MHIIHFFSHPFTLIIPATAAATINQIPHDSIRYHPAAISAAITASITTLDFFILPAYDIRAGGSGMYSPFPSRRYRFLLRFVGLGGAVFFLSCRIVWTIATVAIMFAHAVKTAPIMSLISIAVHLLSMSIVYYNARIISSGI